MITNQHRKNITSEVINNPGMITLSIIIPCYNEENTLRTCIDRVLNIQDKNIKTEIIIIDDASTDKSLVIAESLAKEYREVKVLHHKINQGKGAALRSGFKFASGDFVVIQDADLEYNPMELKKLIVPLTENQADVVIGSRFISDGPHRVLYYWHYLGNRFLTFISNMFTDLNLSDMESCYKVFRKDVLDKIELNENRFGFEPEIVAKIAHMKLRIYEMGISYYGRTYEDGKKIGARDGFRALYCIFRYNALHAPIPIQFIIYLFIGGIAALFNLLVFMILYNAGYGVDISAPAAFISAAAMNYYLSVNILFRQGIKWSAFIEMIVYSTVVFVICIYDLNATRLFLNLDFSPMLSKITASSMGLILNFLGRKYLVFPLPGKRSSAPIPLIDVDKGNQQVKDTNTSLPIIN